MRDTSCQSVDLNIDLKRLRWIIPFSYTKKKKIQNGACDLIPEKGLIFLKLNLKSLTFITIFICNFFAFHLSGR